MARQNAPLLAFNRGEVSKIALARVDLAKLQLAAQCQLNWMPFVAGPAMLRPGLIQVGETLSDQACKTLPFVFAKTDTAHLELTPNKMQVRINEVLLTRVAVGTTVSDPGFNGGGTWSTADTTSGCTATITGGVATLTAAAQGGLARIKQTLSIAGGDQGKEHGLRITVTNGPVTIRIGSAAGLFDYLAQTAIDTGTHSLAFTPTGGSAFLQIESSDQLAKTLTGVAIEAAGVVQIPTPWGAGDLANLRIDQSGDTIYVACYGQQQRKIERRGTRPGARGWSVALYRSSAGPFHDGPELAAKLTPGACFGNTSVSSDKPFFSPNHVGALLRIFTPGQVNNATLGAANTFSTPTRVTGVGVYRTIGIAVAGTWSGTISLQRSLVGADSGFVTIQSTDAGWVGGGPILSGNFSVNFYDDYFFNLNSGGALTVGSSFDNVIAWYRIGFEPGSYVSGTAQVQTNYHDGGGWGIARIVAYSNPQAVNVEVLEPFTNVISSDNWQISDWCAAFGWPTSVCFHENRLTWFSGGLIPIAASQSNNYTGYAQEDRDGATLGDSGAILEGFGEGPSDAVSWGLSLTRLLMGREQSIASARSSNFDQPLTPTDIVVRDCSDQGAQRLPAVKAGKRGIFVQQSGRRVYELAFNSQEWDYDDRDLTRLNLDIGLAGFVAIDKATQPDKMIHLPRGDGQSAALLYDVKDEVEAWWRIQTLGVIEDVCVLPSSQIEDLVYFVVRRTINGVSRRFIERLARRDQCVGGLLNYQLDCALVYSGAAVSTVALAWLPSTAVMVWADGAYLGPATTDVSGNCAMPDGLTHANIVVGLGGAVATVTSASLTGTFAAGAAYEGYPAEVWADVGGTGKLDHLGPLVVSGGNVTLPNGAQALTCVLALGYVAPFESVKLAYAAQNGTALTQKKRVDHVGLVLYDTHYQGLQYGQRFDVLDDMPLIEAGQTTPANTVWAEYDEPVIEVPGDWDTDARLCLLAQAPKPCMLGAAVVAITTNEK